MGCFRDTVGSDYVGTISSTRTERECQRWDDQAPHQHGFTDPTVYPDASIPDAENFCRNLDDDPNGPWCFTNDPKIRKESCNIPLCRGNPDLSIYTSKVSELQSVCPSICLLISARYTVAPIHRRHLSDQNLCHSIKWKWLGHKCHY